jgi:putative tryptophan/tyrosine transport system substrate-binding protein
MRLIGLAVALTLSLTALPFGAEAQQSGKVYRLGCLWAVPASVAAPYRAALEAGLEGLGWVPGQNIAFEHRFPDSPADFPRLAASVVAARVDAIAAMTNPVVAAVASATTDIPIVGVYTTDPVSAGFAVSLSRPAKNITGMTMDASPEIYGKQLELLRQMVPRARRVQVLRNPDWSGTLLRKSAIA